MPEISLLQGNNQMTGVGENTADTTGVTVTAGASANAKGASWQEIVSSTPIPAAGFLLMVGLQGAGIDFLLDLAIGSAGNEKILVENVLHSSKANDGSITSYFFPIPIPAASRLSAKVQSSTGASTVEVIIELVGQSLMLSAPLQNITTYGAATADSGGAGLDPGGTIHTKGGWQEIVASTSRPIKQLLISVGQRANTTMTTCQWLMDIGVGASTAEKILIEALFFGAGTAGDQIAPRVFGPFPVNIPAGSRISGNVQCLINDAADRLIDVILYGMD